jgi:protein ImuB
MKRFSSSNSAAAKDRQAKIQQILAILHKWGIHTVGEFAALDKEQLAGRLGPEGVQMWERANGQSNRPLRLVHPPESFEESFEFEHEIETAEPLLFMLRRFLQQLALRLGATYLVAKELTLRITFANPPQVRAQDGFAAAKKQRYKRVFKIPQPTNDVDLLFRMLHTHLENFKSEYPIIAVSLDAQPTKPPKQQFGLFETTLRNPNQLSETLARLTALLGGDRVGTPIMEETHRPDAFRMEPFSWNSGTGFHPVGQAGVPACDRTGRQDACPPHSHDGYAPLSVVLRRFRSAAAASVFISENWHLQSEKIRGKVIEQRGPYLISGNWWDEKSWAHAEWDLQLENGVICRSYESDEGWKIDGIYD